MCIRDSVDAAPAVIAGLMALVAAITLLHALLTTAQRGRRTLALLRTLGFTGTQLQATVAWHALLLVGAAVVVGLPLGIVAGRWAWILFAQELGVVARSLVPEVALAVAAGAVLVAGVVVAAFPGWRAARIPVAAALRTD